MERGRLRVSLWCVLVGLVLFALPVPAFAATWAGHQPMPDAVVSQAPVNLVVRVATTADLRTGSAVAYVDGVKRTATLVRSGTKNGTVFSSYPAQVGQDGLHTSVVSVADTLGAIHTETWRFTTAIPPTLGVPTPAAGSLIATTDPLISIPVMDNTMIASWEVTVDDQPVSAVLLGGRLNVLLPGPLEDDAAHTVRVTVTDGIGLQATLTWSYDVQVNPEMAVAACGSCHAAQNQPTHTYFAEDCVDCHYNAPHQGTPSAIHCDCDVRWCRPCHVSEITVEHAKYALQCGTCHLSSKPQVQAAILSGDTSCLGCHAETEAHEPDHGLDSPSECAGAGCHVVGSNLVPLHPGVGGGTSCDRCHNSADARVIDAIAAGDKTCGTCHPDRLLPHGYDAAMHTSEDSCIGSCHEPELQPLHATIDAPLSCGGCHPASVEPITPWDKSCSACHTSASHQSAASSHAGSDTLVRDYTGNFSIRTAMSWKSYQFGCSSTPASGQTICHDLSDLSSLHRGTADGGCSICHSTGEVPAVAQECLTCHGTGWYNPATSSGTVARPGADAAVNGVVTRVGGSGSDAYSTVLTNDGDTSSIQLASLDAEALFAKGRWWLNPNTASITSVQVLFRAKKLGVSTTASRITAVVDVGGTTYVNAAAATNPSTAVYTLYTYTFATNPKTGLAWTVADLNDPDALNGLRSFGVRQTASDAASIGVTEVYLKVNTPVTNYNAYPPSGGQAHHYGNYLRSPQTAAGEWSSAIYTQYCYDRCHVYPNTYAYYGQVLGNPTYNPFNAYEGTGMWSSLMGDPNGNSPVERVLTLDAIELPVGSPELRFMTNYSLGTGDVGYVEASTDGGSTWQALSGDVAGVPTAQYTGVAAGWRAARYDLSAYGGQSVKLRFRYRNNAYATNAGWCIDNVSVSEGATVLFSDDAETLRPEWDPGTHWRRIQYALRWLG